MQSKSIQFKNKTTSKKIIILLQQKKGANYCVIDHMSQEGHICFYIIASLECCLIQETNLHFIQW